LAPGNTSPVEQKTAQEENPCGFFSINMAATWRLSAAKINFYHEELRAAKPRPKNPPQKLRGGFALDLCVA
jgi:hypothetical protein